MKFMIGLFWILKKRFSTWYASKFFSLNLGSGVIFVGIPQILKHKKAIINIADNVTINSSNYGYHVNMFSNCKLYADRPYAIINIGANSSIFGTCIHAYKKISIGDNCLIAANTQIIDGNGHQLCFDNPSNRINTSDDGKDIVIENNVWIGTNCIILGGHLLGRVQ